MDTSHRGTHEVELESKEVVKGGDSNSSLPPIFKSPAEANICSGPKAHILNSFKPKPNVVEQPENTFDICLTHGKHKYMSVEYDLWIPNYIIDY